MNIKDLSPQKCLDLLKESGCSDEVIKHSLAVRDVAVRIAYKTDADRNLVEVGALLHDIGRSNTHGIFHAVEGASIARRLNLPKSIIRIIERHIGAGLTKEEAKKLRLPVKNYLPETLEEKIVCHADNLVDNSSRQKIENEIERALTDGNREYAIRLVKLHKELSDICGMDLNDI
ncbi:MAG: HDIG domain-containing protein [Candidatus Thermoplasmatota archaeon]|nr:HDIG domain-containing protein [Candidatus Thermoplasmatota archaeon]